MSKINIQYFIGNVHIKIIGIASEKRILHETFVLLQFGTFERDAFHLGFPF